MWPFKLGPSPVEKGRPIKLSKATPCKVCGEMMTVVYRVPTATDIEVYCLKCGVRIATKPRDP